MERVAKDHASHKGWDTDTRESYILSLSAEEVHVECRFVFSFILYWSLTEGAALAVAQTKDDSRPFAWGLEGVTDLGTACKTSLLVAYDMAKKIEPLCLPLPGHVHYCRLALMIEEHRDAGGADFHTPYGANSWRAFTQLLITLPDGEPQAAKFKIDVERLANDFCMSKETLFDLAETESLRPGCQYGVLAYVARQEAYMYVARQEAREAHQQALLEDALKKFFGE